MSDLRQLLYEKERIGKVLETIRKQGLPDPQSEPERALLYAHALYQYGDLGQAKRVYSAVPPSPALDAERLWGLAAVVLRMGDLKEARRLLAEAVGKNPPSWLLARIHNTRMGLCTHEGDLEAACRSYEQGVEAAEREPSLMMRWVLEGNLGLVQAHQGLYENAVQTGRQAARHRDPADRPRPAGARPSSPGQLPAEGPVEDLPQGRPRLGGLLLRRDHEILRQLDRRLHTGSHITIFPSRAPGRLRISWRHRGFLRMRRWRRCWGD